MAKINVAPRRVLGEEYLEQVVHVSRWVDCDGIARYVSDGEKAVCKNGTVALMRKSTVELFFNVKNARVK